MAPAQRQVVFRPNGSKWVLPRGSRRPADKSPREQKFDLQFSSVTSMVINISMMKRVPGVPQVITVPENHMQILQRRPQLDSNFECLVLALATHLSRPLDTDFSLSQHLPVIVAVISRHKTITAHQHTCHFICLRSGYVRGAVCAS